MNATNLRFSWQGWPLLIDLFRKEAMFVAKLGFSGDYSPGLLLGFMVTCACHIKSDLENAD